MPSSPTRPEREISLAVPCCKEKALCTCRKDMVTISMDIFVKKFQPDRYHLWKQGKDLYTIDHTKPTPEMTPEVKAWLLRRKKTKRSSRCSAKVRLDKMLLGGGTLCHSPLVSEFGSPEIFDYADLTLSTKTVFLQFMALLIKDVFRARTSIKESRIQLLGRSELACFGKRSHIMLAVFFADSDSEDEYYSGIEEQQGAQSPDTQLEEVAELISSRADAEVRGTFILVDILSYPSQTFCSDSSISYNSFQHTRSRSKKLKTPEDKKVSTIVVGTEITATEAATDSFKVKEKPSEKVNPVNTGVPSGEEEDTSWMQIDQNLLDNKKVPDHNSSSSQHSHSPLMKKIQLEIEEKEVFVPTCSEESTLALCSPASCNQDEDFITSTTSGRTLEYLSSEAENLEKEETSSVSTEEGDVSDGESSENGLEPGEISLVTEGERTTTSKSWRHPLNKPPARSPMTLVKQQAISDEELPEALSIEEEIQETESWAKPLVYLWQNRAPNFTAEKEYNASVAKLEPYCAICTLLRPYYKPDKTNEEIYASSETKQREKFVASEKTKPLIPEICFIYSEENTENYPSNRLVEEDGTSLLISCAKCCVQVHASNHTCVGLSVSQKGSQAVWASRFEVAMVFLPMKSMMDGCVLDAKEEPGQL
ncbi:Lysine-specific demethylase 4C [Varanus komodoensis]|nr:Lysine-specific demethylase 4C [Varanus komodoensis]